MLVLDELDAKLHPKLLLCIIGLFRNPKVNTGGSQLLFSSHDIATLKSTVFRRDEIWFACLDDKRSSHIFSLYDIRDEKGERVPKHAAFDKQYLEGRYEAVPHLGSTLVDSWT